MFKKLLSTTGPAEVQHHRLILNVWLYHISSYDPRSNPLEASEETSDNKNVDGLPNMTDNYLEELIDYVP